MKYLESDLHNRSTHWFYSSIITKGEGLVGYYVCLMQVKLSVHSKFLKESEWFAQVPSFKVSRRLEASLPNLDKNTNNFFN